MICNFFSFFFFQDFLSFFLYIFISCSLFFRSLLGPHSYNVLVINPPEFRPHPLYHSTIFRIHFTINKVILNGRFILKGTVVLFTFWTRERLAWHGETQAKGGEERGEKGCFLLSVKAGSEVRRVVMKVSMIMTKKGFWL